MADRRADAPSGRADSARRRAPWAGIRADRSMRQQSDSPMTLDPVLSALMSGGVEVSDISTPRPNELHCILPADQLNALYHAACGVLGADLILMAADDRRSVAGAFFVHYLYAHRTANWFLQAS